MEKDVDLQQSAGKKWGIWANKRVKHNWLLQSILQFVAARCSKTLLHNWYSP